MKAGAASLGAVYGLLAFMALLSPGGTESLADLQARFDRETNGVHKAKLIEKLGDAQFEEARRAGRSIRHSPEMSLGSLTADLLNCATSPDPHLSARERQTGYPNCWLSVTIGVRQVSNCWPLSETFLPL